MTNHDLSLLNNLKIAVTLKCFFIDKPGLNFLRERNVCFLGFSQMVRFRLET